MGKNLRAKAKACAETEPHSSEESEALKPDNQTRTSSRSSRQSPIKSSSVATKSKKNSKHAETNKPNHNAGGYSDVRILARLTKAKFSKYDVGSTSDSHANTKANQQGNTESDVKDSPAADVTRRGPKRKMDATPDGETKATKRRMDNPEESMVVDRPKRERSRKTIDSDNKGTEENGSMSSIKKDNMSEASMPARSLKRKTKQANSPAAEVACAEQEEQEVLTLLPKRRGRPRKVTPVMTAAETDCAEEEKVAPLPKRRGRPRQQTTVTADAETDSAEEEKVAPLPKRRGRPRKQTTVTADAETDSAEVLPKKKCQRGRPRTKTSATPAAEFNEDEPAKLKKPTKCHHCDYVDATNQGMKYHYAKEHTLLYSREYPEGTNTAQGALTKILNMIGKLTCQKCGKAIKFTHYYRSHIKFCGREAETGNCELCGKSQKLEWLRMHELKCKKDHEAKVAQLELQQAQDEATKDNDELGGKRRAAAK